MTSNKKNICQYYKIYLINIFKISQKSYLMATQKINYNEIAS